MDAEPVVTTPVPNQEWELLWHSELAKPWSALAVVGTDTTRDACVTAEILAAVGSQLGKPVRVVSAVGAANPDAEGIAAHVASWSQGGTHLLIACDPLKTNTSTLPVLQATSGVVLVVRLGESLLASARQTVSAVGRDRVFATIAIG